MTTAPDDVEDRLVRNRVAIALGWTDGQLQTAGIGLGLVALMTALGVPPVLDGRALTPAAQQAPAAPDAAAAPLAQAPLAAPAVPAPPVAPDPAVPAPLAFDAPVSAPLPAPGTPPAPPFLPPAQQANPAPPVLPGDPALTVREAGWFTAEPGPLATVDVPPDGLPVAARATMTTRMSLLRLAGAASGTTLTLSLAEGTGAQQLEDAAALQACPVLEPDWEAAPAQPLSEAPPVNTSDCAAGTRGTGSWTFDLSAFPDPRSANGFAIVPVSTPDRPAFQVTFKGPTS